VIADRNSSATARGERGKRERERAPSRYNHSFIL
jgi:hypothetical protein